MKPIIKNILIFFIVVVIIGAALSLYNATPGNKPTVVGMETLIAHINDEQVKSIEIKGDSLNIVLNDDTKEIVVKEAGESFSDLVKNYNLDPVKVAKAHPEVKNDNTTAWIGALLPFLIPVLLLIVLVYVMGRQIQGANSRAMMFGSSRARKLEADNKKNRVTFKDVAGIKESKEELKEIIEFLKDHKKFTDLGAKIPKGVLLVGPPGTGKTLLAKAVAGEADVPFFHVSGSEFIEMFVGVGASRVRDLFTRAKKSAPCIVFIDEIDAVGRQRGAGLGGSNDEREQTLNQILVELDGFEPNDNVIVMAATNRPDVLDPALLRPGRFDRRVFLDPPSINDREEILQVHAQKKPLAADVSLRKIAERTPGFSGADLANLLNESAILTARKDRKEVLQDDIIESIEKVMLGPQRKSHILSDEEKKVTAYHEAGHAIVSHAFKKEGSVQKVSIISRGRAAGYTLNMPTEDKYFTRKKEFLADLAVMMGGYVTEELIFGDVSTGAHNDLSKATDVARKMVTDYGMSPLGPQTFGHDDEAVFLGRDLVTKRNYSESTAESIDEQVKVFIHGAYEEAKKVVTHHRTKLEEIVQLLLEKETIEQEEFASLFAV
ncbi:MAG: ATP-dependent zinc metalloprotease FtsH [bacterium]|nr:ATP-dependent zinc metalloprotease FtsH [bacterium]